MTGQIPASASTYPLYSAGWVIREAVTAQAAGLALTATVPGVASAQHTLELALIVVGTARAVAAFRELRAGRSVGFDPAMLTEAHPLMVETPLDPAARKIAVPFFLRELERALRRGQVNLLLTTRGKRPTPMAPGNQGFIISPEGVGWPSGVMHMMGAPHQVITDVFNADNINAWPGR